MPQVPYQAYPTAEPKEIPTPTLGLSTPGAAFGENIARAVEGLGKVTEHVGDELFQRALGLQALQNESAATEAKARFIMQSGDLHAKFSQQEGINAGPEALRQHIGEINKLRESIRGSLPNDAVRKMYDGESTGFMARNIFNAAGHSASEMKRYHLETIKTGDEAVNNEIAHNPDSAAAVESGRRTLEELNHREAGIRGWDDTQATSELDKKVSKLTMQRLIGMARNGKPNEAADLFEAQREFLRGADLDNTKRVIDTYRHSAGARIIAEDIVKPPVDGKFDRTEAEQMAEAEKRGGDDPLARDANVRAVVSRRNTLNNAVKEFNTENRITIDTAMNNNRPTNEAELLQDPDAARAWSHMNESQRKPYYAGFLNNARMPERERKAYDNSPEGIARYRQLRGMAQNAPTEFQDIAIGNEKFSGPIQRELSRLQAQSQKQGESDPRVGQALTHLRASRGPTMEALGIFNRTKDKDSYDHFVGALQESLDVWRDTHGGKPPTPKEIDEIGDKLFYQQAVPPAWYWPFTTHEEPVYNIKVPDDVAEQIKKDVPNATDEQIRREFVRLQLKRLYANQPTPK